jgi:hypothetical protein
VKRYYFEPNKKRKIMNEAKTNENGFWDKMFDGELEMNRFAIISAVLLIVGCMGGLTVGFGAIHHTWQLIAVVIPTMATLSLLLAVAPVKTILNFAVVSICVNLIILAINLVG